MNEEIIASWAVGYGMHEKIIAQEAARITIQSSDNARASVFKAYIGAYEIQCSTAPPSYDHRAPDHPIKKVQEWLDPILKVEIDRLKELDEEQRQEDIRMAEQFARANLDNHDSRSGSSDGNGTPGARTRNTPPRTANTAPSPPNPSAGGPLGFLNQRADQLHLVLVWDYDEDGEAHEKTFVAHCSTMGAYSPPRRGVNF